MDKSEPNFFGDFLSAINDFKKTQEERAQQLAVKLEGAEVEQLVFFEKEVAKIIEIRQALKKFAERAKSEGKDQKYLDEAIKYLDSLDCWIYKFSTGDLDKPSSGDSLYYVMHSGASLRLKRMSLGKEGGLGRVIQPFMEKIFFEDKDSEPIEQLQIGNTPREYCSEEFRAMQDQTSATEFVSQVRSFYKGRKLIFVEKPQHLYHDHNGDTVNNIFIK